MFCIAIFLVKYLISMAMLYFLAMGIHPNT